MFKVPDLELWWNRFINMCFLGELKGSNTAVLDILAISASLPKILGPRILIKDFRTHENLGSSQRSILSTVQSPVD